MKESTLINARLIETLFREHYQGLCRYAYSILKNQEGVNNLTDLKSIFNERNTKIKQSF